MPKELEAQKDAIWSSLKGKKNPRTGKQYTESDAYAIATASFKKRNKGGKNES